MAPFPLERLAELDLQAPAPLQAAQFKAISATFCCTRPAAFCCSDGQVYWVKSHDAVPGALTYELIVGRLGALTGFAPPSAVVVVPEAAIPAEPAMRRFLGAGVGVRDVPKSYNFDGPQIPDVLQLFRSIRIDHKTWLAAATFHSWLGMGDPQVLVNVSTGQVCSIDHERCFAAGPDDTPVPVVKRLCFGSSPPKDMGAVQAAVNRIEAITDDQLLSCVAALPDSFPTLLPRIDRLRVAKQLAARRDRLRAVMEAWATSP